MEYKLLFRYWNGKHFVYDPQVGTNECMIKICSFKNYEFNQYIGIRAKNKNVYEGDIIAVNGKYPKIVRRSKSGFNFCLVNISDLQFEKTMDIEQFPDKKWLEDYKDELEIIGNIYENPELLNDK